MIVENNLTKEEYLHIKEKGEVNFKLCWQYFQFKKPAHYPDITLPEFNLKFRDFLSSPAGTVFYTQNGAKIINIPFMQQKIFDYFDYYYENGHTRD